MRPAFVAAVRVVDAASASDTGVTCIPEPSSVKDVVIAPVLLFFETTEKPFSDRTEPLKVVLAM
jgi:hypothetical protein